MFCNLSTITKMPFYAVAKGRSSGIYHSWAECEAQVKGFSGATFKKFDTASSANDFIHSNSHGGGDYASSSSFNYYQSGSASNNLNRAYSTSSKNNNYYGNRSSSWSNSADLEPQPKQYERNSKTAFEEDSEGYVQVHTDGACSANGTRGAQAGLGVYWGADHPLNLSEPVSGRATNNCGEIQAATSAIKTAVDNGVKKLAINTDSQFLIKAATEWMPGWKERGWKLASGEAVKNETDFKELDSVLDKVDIKWNYVKAHDGIHGNEMADGLAKAGAAMYNK